jgi:hypothetical protein
MRQKTLGLFLAALTALPLSAGVVTGVADVGITGSVAGTAFATFPITKNFTITNNGPDTATGVTFTDSIPTAAGQGFNSAIPSQGTCDFVAIIGATTVTCNLGTLASGASATVALSVTPDTPGPHGNTGTISTSSIDNNPANNSATVNFTALPAGAIPAMSTMMLALLGAALGGIALLVMRR